jgi:LEA14-like dessication related protein
MDRRRAAAGVAVAAVVVAGSVLAFGLLDDDLRAPEFGVVDRGDWTTDDGVGVVTTVWANNTNPVAVSGLSLSYRTSLNGVTVAAGERRNLTLPRGNTTLSLPSRLRTDRLPAWWVAYVRANETLAYRVEADARIDAGGLSATRTLSREGTLFADRQPVLAAVSAAAGRATGTYTRTYEALGLRATVGYELTDVEAEWGPVSRERTILLVRYTVHNAGDVPVPAAAEGLNLTVEANGIVLFRTRGAVAPGDVELLEEGESRTVTLRLELDNDRVDDWFVSHVRRGERSRVNATVALRFRLPASTPVLREPVEVTVPPDGLAAADCTVRTDVFVDGAVAGADCSG